MCFGVVGLGVQRFSAFFHVSGSGVFLGLDVRVSSVVGLKAC